MSEEDQGEYRLWDRHDQKMIYAEDAKNAKEVLAIGLHGLPIAVDQDSFRDGGVVGWNVDHRYVPMQFTGVRTYEDMKIYKNDIIEFRLRDSSDSKKYRRIVEFHEGGFMADMATSLRSAMWVKVIGNVHENPDLAKEIVQS